MFTTKQTSLFEVKKKPTSNSFTNAGLKTSAETTSGNGSLKFSTTGNDFVDQFGKIGSYKQPRPFVEIQKDNRLLYSLNPKLAVIFILFLRTITRLVSFVTGEKTETVQRGAGLKHEAIMRMIDLYTLNTKVFWNNLNLFVSVGSWKDIFEMLHYDIEYNGWEKRVLDWGLFSDFIIAGLSNANTTNLVRKYLPQIKARSKCTTLQLQADTVIGKFICSRMGISYKLYREMKSTGIAHVWQQKISKRLFDEIDFNSIHGKALAKLVSGKFLKNQKLEAKYLKWIKSQPVAKFTGYVHELLSNISSTMESYKVETINKQFAGLIETAKKNAKTETSLIVVRDTSASMSGLATGTKISCGNIAKSLALYFSEFLTGYFADTWIEFNSKAVMYKWKGKTVVEKWINDTAGFVGSTDFLSVIDLFVKIKAQGIPESDFPTGILCISDGEFNSTNMKKTNFELAKDRLSNSFSPEYVKNFKFVFWNLSSNYYGSDTGKKFETYGNAENVFYFSGYDGAIMAFLTGVEGQKSEPKTAEDLFAAAMNQEVLNLVEI